jgi:hypothetical protein
MDLNSVSFCLCCNPTNTTGQSQSAGITTISNFNWVNLMGEMWYKYKRFNLTPCGFNCQQYSVYGNYGVCFSGLPFINITDSIPSKSNDVVDVGFAYNAQFPFAQAYSNSCSTMFERPPRTTDITIRFISRAGITITAYPPIVAMFKITPVLTNEEIVKIPRTLYLQKTGVCLQLYSVNANATLDDRGRVFQFNVDMRAVLGSLFDKYSRFILQTTKVNYIYNPAAGFDGQYAGLLYSAGIYLSGLDWVSTFEFPASYGGQTLLANAVSGNGTLYTKKPSACIAPYTYVLTNTGEFIMNVINKFEINTNTMAELIMYQGYNGSGDLLQMSTVNTNVAAPFSVIFMIYGDEEFRIN